MESIGKFQIYYQRIYKEVSDIKKENNYKNLSKAFSHWYFEKFLGMGLQEISEAIIDGIGDNGIDAIIFQNDTVILYQFKFPDKVKNIEKEISQTTVLKLLSGYTKLTSSTKPRVRNDSFENCWDEIKNNNYFSYKFIFVGYCSGFSCHAEEALNTQIDSILAKTGNKIQYEIITKNKICDLVDKTQKRSVVNIDLKYARLDPSYNVSNCANSWSGFANAMDILNACQSSLDVIFDENIRLYEENAPVNNGIKKTASSDDSKFFYFFHNGIVFICDSCRNSTGNQTAHMSASSIVNGCQTIVSLQEVNNKGELKDNVFLPIRIIETDDFDLRAKITEYLNSQSKIKDSYYLANNTFVKELQSQLIKKGYFLERLANEYSYKSSLKKIQSYEKNHILPLEKTIQVYAAYFNNEYAAMAKRAKNDLFKREVADVVLSYISADRVLEAISKYNEICKKIKIFRKCSRSKGENHEFLDFLGISTKSFEDYQRVMKKYSFINTADILLLNAFSNLKKNVKFEDKNDDEIIRYAISVCNEVINSKPDMNYSAATKNTTVFEEIQKRCGNTSIK